MLASTFLGIPIDQWGQALLGLLVAVTGYILHRNGKQIHVLVNSRLESALARIAALEASLGIKKGDPIPPPTK